MAKNFDDRGIVPNGGGSSDGNATRPADDGKCAPNCPGCVLDEIERNRS